MKHDKLIAQVWLREPWLLEELLQRHKVKYINSPNGILAAVVDATNVPAFSADLEKLRYANYVEAIVAAVGGITQAVAPLIGQNKAQKMQEDAWREQEKQHQRDLQLGSINAARQRELATTQLALSRQASMQGVLQQIAASQGGAAKQTQAIVIGLAVVIAAGLLVLVFIGKKKKDGNISS